MSKAVSLKNSFVSLSGSQKMLVIVVLACISIGSFLLGYFTGHNKAIDESCKKILDASYNQLKQDDWMALKLGKEECIKKLIRQ